jgi:hypothetical protein
MRTTDGNLRQSRSRRRQNGESGSGFSSDLRHSARGGSGGSKYLAGSLPSACSWTRCGARASPRASHASALVGSSCVMPDKVVAAADTSQRTLQSSHAAGWCPLPWLWGDAGMEQAEEYPLSNEETH